MGVAFGISWGRPRSGARQLLAGVLATGLLLPLATAPGSRADLRITDPGAASVIVRASAGAVDAVERSVATLGGTVRRQLPLIDGFSADVPAGHVPELGQLAGVRAVTPDGTAHVLGMVDRAPDKAPRADKPGAVGTSMEAITRGTGAEALWDSGSTGAGVDVALIDTGVAPVAGLDGPGKVVNGPDFSSDAAAAGTPADGFGHGTHMAGIIAGSDAVDDPSTGFQGMAPGARVVNVKVADAAGDTTVSRLIAAIDWVVDNKDADGLHIGVLNLSFGVDSDQPYVSDPLAFAVERAWQAGIVVVAAAGNAGYLDRHGVAGLSDPAYDPFVVAVGAADTRGTLALNDDKVADFSSRAGGTNDRDPDVVAPGRAIQSLLAPGSAVAAALPNGKRDDRFVKGSGTSQAAAVVSGAAALLLSQRPGITPDQVKALLSTTATPLRNAAASSQGAGEIDLGAAAAAGTPIAAQLWPAASADGSDPAIDQSWTGQDTSFGSTGNGTSAGKGGAGPQGHSWSGHSWSGHSWSGHSWSTSEWTESQ